MTYSRAVAVLCFIVVMLITALTPLGVPGPTTDEADHVTETVAAPRVPPQGGTARGEEPLMRKRYAALAAAFILVAALAATILLSSAIGPLPRLRSAADFGGLTRPLAGAAVHAVADPHPDRHGRGRRQR